MTPGKALQIAKMARIEELAAAGIDSTQIAERVGLTQSSISAKLKRAGWEPYKQHDWAVGTLWRRKA